MARLDPALAMMMSLTVTLGVFLLLGFRDPFAQRSLISADHRRALDSRSDRTNLNIGID